MSKPLPVFVEKICSHRGACVICRRDDAAGASWRSAIQQAFAMPLSWPDCVIGLPMGATAGQVRATAGKPVPGVPGVATAPALVPMPFDHGVGTEIRKILSGLGISSCQQCVESQVLWDSWGVAECERHAGLIEATLIARANERGWLSLILGPAAELMAGRVVHRAIAAAKTDPLARP